MLKISNHKKEEAETETLGYRNGSIEVKLEGKVAIVTGAGSGIGRVIAMALAQEGSRVVIAERDKELGKRVAAEIISDGGKAIQRKVDVSKGSEVNEVVKDILVQFGKIDILVNNAGIARVENFLDGEEWRWDRILAVNLKGIILFSRAVLESMVKQNYGKIVNISSIVGETGAPYQVVYSASKGGIIAFTKSLAKEMAPYKINVNCICPGMIETQLMKVALETRPNLFRSNIDRIPLGRLGKPEDIAAITVFLVSDEAEYIVGQAICVDGGITTL